MRNNFRRQTVMSSPKPPFLRIVHRWLGAYRKPVRLFLLGTGLVAATPFIFWGIRADFWIVQRVLFLYVAPLVFLFFLWLRARVDESEEWSPLRLVLDGAVVVAAALRMIPSIGLPWSGHMVFLVYTFATTREQLYRWIALGLVIETSVFKLWFWNDWQTWSIGTVLGMCFALLYLFVPIYQQRGK